MWQQAAAEGGREGGTIQCGTVLHINRATKKKKKTGRHRKACRDGKLRRSVNLGVTCHSLSMAPLPYWAWTPRHHYCCIGPIADSRRLETESAEPPAAVLLLAIYHHHHDITSHDNVASKLLAARKEEMQSQLSLAKSGATYMQYSTLPGVPQGGGDSSQLCFFLGSQNRKGASHLSQYVS